MQDCLPQEEYRKVYPEGESESPFVFICTDPQELPIRFPIKGSHKICMFYGISLLITVIAAIFVFTDKIDPNIHTAAVKSLQRLAKLQVENDE